MSVVREILILLLALHSGLSAHAQVGPTSRPATVPTTRPDVRSAVRVGDIETLMKLLEAGMDPNTPLDDRGMTPLMEAALNDQAESLILLLEYRTAISQADRNGATALHFAVLAGHYRMAVWLCDRGADINAKAPGLGSITPLQMAVLQNHPNIATFLTRQKADLDAKDDEGMTALHLAAKHGRTLIAYGLVRSGADTSALNVEGKTAVEVGRAARNTQVVEVIEAGLRERSTTQPATR